ncbi:DUF1461 domain-containing protein [Chloroflexota bacterium]
MKIPATVAKWILILSLPLLLLTASIAWAANSLWVYQSGFERHDISQTTGLAESELEAAARGLIRYFNSSEEHISITVEKDSQQFELFTPEEIIHFRDVKELFRLDYYLLLGTLIYILGYAGVNLFWQRKRHWQRLARGGAAGSGITLALLLVLGLLGAFFDFGQIWVWFHLLSFDNPHWSAPGYMLLLFPQGFWYDTALLCGGITAGLAAILGGVSGGYLLATRKSRATS